MNDKNTKKIGLIVDSLDILIIILNRITWRDKNIEATSNIKEYEKGGTKSIQKRV